MERIYPSYYNDFHCIAAGCPDSCCQEWDVQVDGESARRYAAIGGALGDDLRRDLYREDGEVYLRNRGGRCPMWRSDGLCRIQAELGHDALCQVCREFPRLRQDYGSFLELGLEMSCPEAARIMLSAEDWHLVTETVAGGEAPEYDGEAMALLRQTRPRALALLEDGRFSIPERLAVLLMYGYHVQAALDGGDLTAFDPSDALAEAREFAGAGDPGALPEFYRGLEILTVRWREKLSAGAGAPNWDRKLLNFAQYGVYRYYYQAVLDYDLTGRVKMVISGCILTALLGAEERTIQLYAKEIENDAENVDALLDGAYAHPALTDANLLGILLK